jgi:hypothetical protein
VGEWQTRYVNDVVAGNDICVKTTKNGRALPSLPSLPN